MPGDLDRSIRHPQRCLPDECVGRDLHVVARPGESDLRSPAPSTFVFITGLGQHLDLCVELVVQVVELPQDRSGARDEPLPNPCDVAGPPGRLGRWMTPSPSSSHAMTVGAIGRLTHRRSTGSPKTVSNQRIHHRDMRRIRHPQPEVTLVVLDDDAVVADHARTLFEANVPLAVVSNHYTAVVPFMLGNNGYTVALVADVDDPAQLAGAIAITEQRLGPVAAVLRYATDLPHRPSGSHSPASAA